MMMMMMINETGLSTFFDSVQLYHWLDYEQCCDWLLWGPSEPTSPYLESGDCGRSVGAPQFLNRHTVAANRITPHSEDGPQNQHGENKSLSMVRGGSFRFRVGYWPRMLLEIYSNGMGLKKPLLRKSYICLLVAEVFHQGTRTKLNTRRSPPLVISLGEMGKH